MREFELEKTPQRTIAWVSLKAIIQNLDILVHASKKREHSKFKGAVPMLKSNAYGHGILPVAQSLEEHENVLALGLATFYEGFVLRKAGVKKPVWIFSDGSPWSEEFTQACESYCLNPIIHSFEDLKTMLRRFPVSRINNLGFQLKFNTGMNRLGIEMSELGEVVRLLKNVKAKPTGICTHFAEAEKPSSSLTNQQLQRFGEVVQAFSEFSISHIHCANSDGILHETQTRVQPSACNVIRPGLAIYGYGAEKRLKPALRWGAHVLQTRKLKAGEKIGYGGTYKTKQPIQTAVLGFGYGDGMSRRLSNKEVLVLVLPKGTKKRKNLRLQWAKVLGRVSMDLLTVQLECEVGDWVVVLGHSKEQATALAQRSETIVYEVLTSIGSRVERIYDKMD